MSVNVHQGYIEACEQEPLATCGQIQPHGALLACRGSDRVITHVSANIGSCLGQSAQSLLGTRLYDPLASWLDEGSPEHGQRRYLDEQWLAGGFVDVVLTRAEDHGFIFEFLPIGASLTQSSPLSSFPSEPQNHQDFAQLRQWLVETLRAISGFERVMFYSFHHQGDGTVAHEAVSDKQLGAFLGLRFPASDIPKIARTLYLKNPWRSIPDSRAEMVPVLSEQTQPLDLSLTDLRGLSPIHQVYMQNMGVGAAISFPIKTDQRLIALISLHHRRPMQLCQSALRQLAMLVTQYNMAEVDFSARLRMQRMDALNRRFSLFVERVGNLDDLFSDWNGLSDWLLDEFVADGVVFMLDQTVLTAGEIPDERALTAIDECFAERSEPLWMTDCLSGDCPNLPLTQIAGVLAVRVGELPHQNQDCVYFFRGEYIHEVSWGGNPNKPAEYVTAEQPIAPRRSFERWVEQRMGHARPWPDGLRLALLKLRVNLQRVINNGYG